MGRRAKPHVLRRATFSAYRDNGRAASDPPVWGGGGVVYVKGVRRFRSLRESPEMGEVMT